MSTGALPDAGAPLLTVATLSKYARSAYSPYAGHFPPAGLASAHPVYEAVRQPICADSVRVYPGITSVETVMLVPSDNAYPTGITSTSFISA